MKAYFLTISLLSGINNGKFLFQHSKKVDFSSNRYSEPTFEFYDQHLLTEVS